jgi:pimeloyl-ACP methyl ester carboxylesterase
MAFDACPDLPGVTHRHVVVNGIRLHVAEAGDGPPLVLLHGWPQHWWCWRHVIAPLAEEYRVLAPDLRGFGWSDAPAGDYAKATWAADILALLDAEGIDRVSLMGHDWGGYVGFLLALAQPGRLQRFVALDIAPPWLTGRPRARQLALPLMGSYQALLATPVLGPRTVTTGAWFVRALIRAGSRSKGPWTAEEFGVYADVLRSPARARASSACYRTFLTRELPATLLDHTTGSDLEVPTLLVMGGASPLRWVLDPQPGLNLQVDTIPHAGHFLPEEAPHDVLRLARNWLHTHNPGSPRVLVG